MQCFFHESKFEKKNTRFRDIQQRKTIVKNFVLSSVHISMLLTNCQLFLFCLLSVKCLSNVFCLALCPILHLGLSLWIPICPLVREMAISPFICNSSFHKLSDPSIHYQLNPVPGGGGLIFWDN